MHGTLGREPGKESSDEDGQHVEDGGDRGGGGIVSGGWRRDGWGRTGPAGQGQRLRIHSSDRDRFADGGFEWGPDA